MGSDGGKDVLHIKTQLAVLLELHAALTGIAHMHLQRHLELHVALVFGRDGYRCAVVYVKHTHYKASYMSKTPMTRYLNFVYSDDRYKNGTNKKK